MAPQRNPDLLGSYCLPKHQVISVRSEQNPSKLQHTVRDVFYKSFGFLKGSLHDVFKHRSAAKG